MNYHVTIMTQKRVDGSPFGGDTHLAPPRSTPLPEGTMNNNHQALIAVRNSAAALAELHDRTEAVDALLRFALGQDSKDRDLLASAFAEDAELDFRPAASKWGAQPPVMRGRDNIVDIIMGMFAGRVDTTHQVTNARVCVSGDTAELTALVEAHHLLIAAPGTHALLKNPYQVTLVRDGARWVIQRMRIENSWLVGEPQSIFSA